MTPHFDKKVALVTGSGRGIGRAIALKLAAEGANIVINFVRNKDSAENTANEIRALGRRALVVKANVGKPEHLTRLFDEIEREFGRLDILVHNAASGFNKPLMSQRERSWEWTMNINARSLLFESQRAVSLMSQNGGGAIVALSSLGAVRTLPDYGIVGVSKAAIEALVRYLAVELAPKNITVNAVAPGVVKTEALEKFAAFREAEQEGDVLEKLASATPVGRLCTPEEVAEVVAFLCTPAAKMICGQTIVLDGGQSLVWG
ncbi:MAG: enoyl-[acyl-carrier-protein] reductase FabL [Candidatus Promineifilaceae bacterium]